MKSSAKKTRIQTTLSQLALQRAKKLMEEVYGMSDLNDLFERLIIEEYERRHGKIVLDEKQVLSKHHPPKENPRPAPKV